MRVQVRLLIPIAVAASALALSLMYWGREQRLRTLNAALEHGSATEREGAIMAFASWPDPRAAPALIGVLDTWSPGRRQRSESEEDRVAAAAAEVLGRSHDPAAVPALANALATGNQTAAPRAARALARIGRPAVPALVGVLTVSEWRECDEGAHCQLAPLVYLSADRVATGELPRHSAVGRAIQQPRLSRAERVEPVRKGAKPLAADALVSIGLPAVPGVVEYLLTTGASSARQPDPCVRRVMMRIGRSAVPALVSALRGRRPGRQAVVDVLADVAGDDAAAPLLEALGDDDSRVRASAAFGLGRTGGARAVEPLARALRDGTGDVRVAAAQGLGLVADESAAAPLLGAISSGDDPLAKAAAWTLGRRGPAGCDALASALRDPRCTGRAHIPEVLAECGGQTAIPVLAEATRDADKFVRASAIQALGRTDRTEACRPLLAALQDDSPMVRGCAVDALGRLRSESAAAGLVSCLGDDDVGVRNAAHDALEAIGEPAVPALVDALRSSSAEVRGGAASVLVMHGRSSATRALVDALGREGDAEAAGCMVEALLNRQGHGGLSDDYFIAKLNSPLGSLSMANVLFDAGRTAGGDRLEKAARAWARARGYVVVTTYQGGRWSQSEP